MGYKCRQAFLFIVLVPIGAHHLGRCYLRGSCKNILFFLLVIATWVAAFRVYSPVLRIVFICALSFYFFLNVLFFALFIDECANNTSVAHSKRRVDILPREQGASTQGHQLIV